MRGVGGQREKGVQIEDSKHGTEKDENDIDTPPLLLLGFLFLKVWFCLRFKDTELRIQTCPMSLEMKSKQQTNKTDDGCKLLSVVLGVGETQSKLFTC